MAGLRETLGKLQGLRRRFEKLLTTQGKSSRSGEELADRSTRLRELGAFGSNPGNLRMLAHIPDRLPDMPAMVVALHGCIQTADDYNHGVGWSTLADRRGFIVVYPQQQPSNNAKNCFSWFLPNDIARDRGEALSIRQMVEHAIASFGVDRRQVFVTGLSAGGAMASVMLATYPEVFAGGAIVAGLPYGCAASVQEAFETMFAKHSLSARALGDRVRAATRHRGPWPRISVWHGSADTIVAPSNAQDIVRQWASVHGLSLRPSHEEKIAGHTRRIWSDADGNALIEAFIIRGMAHGVPIAPRLGAEGCGATGAFFLDVGISSSHRIAKFWGLGEDRAGRLGVAPTLAPPEPTQIRAATREIETFARARRVSIEPGNAPFRSSETDDVHWSLDPNLVIATAFKAAGLPIPDVPSRLPEATPRVAPGPIIEAALKAAGLIK